MKVTRANIKEWLKIANDADFADMYSSSVRNPRYDAYNHMVKEIPFKFMAQMLKQQLGIKE